MECNCSLLVWSTLLLSAILILFLSKIQSRNRTKQLPPGPPGWPVFGNMLDIGTMPHQTFYKLKFKYGPVLWLKLGFINTMVVQSAKAAADLFKNHDSSFCDRMCLDVYTTHNYNKGSLALGRYGAYWRILRRICSMELLVNKRINETALVRRKCIDRMISSIEEEVHANSHALGDASGVVNLAHVLFHMAFNLVGNLMLSRDLLDSQSKTGLEFFDAMNEIMEGGGKPNLVDFLPFLKWLDPQGIKRKMVKDLGVAMKIVAGFMEERVEEQKIGTEKAKDFLNALLGYKSDGKEGADKISDQNVNIIILEMFFAGSETTSSTIEWAMAELLRNRESMRKAKEELDRIVGPKRKVEESDIDELPYLQAVVKETLRLHPPVPLMLPRNTIQDTNYMGYLIPKDTQVLVNAWAIGRDPDSWENPLLFKPERFLGSNIEYNGQNYELIPFGSGRRICVGISLAHRVVHLGLASLLHCFDWELGSNATPETIDMNERMGITIRKLIPLKVLPKKRVV